MGGKVISCKQIDRNGIPVGIVEGYIATWDVDRCKDKFIPGCFKKSLDRYRSLGRPIRLKNNHGKVIGNYPIETVREDERGLFGIGEINLEVQEGIETYSLIRQKSLSDESIGFTAEEVTYKDDTRNIIVSEIWEGSIVEEPMNEKAVITEVKTVNGRGNLPSLFFDRSYKWDSVAAEERIKKLVGEKCAGSYLWHEDNDKSYKFPIADVVDGSIKIVPRAVFAVRAVLSGARGGVDIPEADQEKIKGIINTLYGEMEMEEPFNGQDIRPITITELKCASKSDLAHIIQYCELTKNASSYLSTLSLQSTLGEEEETKEIDDGVKDLLESMQKIKSELRRE